MWKKRIAIAFMIICTMILFCGCSIDEITQIETKVTDETEVANETETQQIQVGYSVFYGHYPQTASFIDATPIEWTILEICEDENKVLLISKYALTGIQFDIDGYQGWEKSYIRSWLNGQFLNTAFSPTEQQGIITTKVITSDYCGHSGGADTQDKIWLLSIDEAKTYFESKDSRKVKFTAYAYANGVNHYSSGHCWWWLRTPGFNTNYASVVDYDGSFNDIGGRSDAGALRPALWLDMDSLNLEESSQMTMEIVNTKKSSHIQIGQSMFYGHYPQTADGKDNSPIEWIVLKIDRNDNNVLLISRYGLDAQVYHNGTEGKTLYPTWEKSSIRTWLNGKFINAAFTKEEQKAVLTTRVGMEFYSKDNGGPDTKDKVWLLSENEANDYFKNDDEKKVMPTDYAIARGATTLLSNDGCCLWWLRSPWYFGDTYASKVDGFGNISQADVTCSYAAVRPAIWLDLDTAELD